MRHFLYIVFSLALLVTGCAPATATEEPTPIPPTETVESVTLTVFAASSLTDAFTEIGKDFETANPGVTVALNFAGSQTLRTQIEEGAPADIFASASGKEMDAAIEGKFISEDTKQLFLSNKLIVILPADNPAGLEKLEDLANAGVKIVLAAEEVPVGNYARQSLGVMNGSFGAEFKDMVLANVVSNEDNVKQVVAKVQLGEADAGIVYTSDAVAAPELPTIDIPTELNVIAKYPIAPLAASANADLAQEFIDYVLSVEGQTILEKWGFDPIQ